MKRAMKEDESDKLVSTLYFRSVLQDELLYKVFEAVRIQVRGLKTALSPCCPPRGGQVLHQR